MIVNIDFMTYEMARIVHYYYTGYLKTKVALLIWMCSIMLYKLKRKQSSAYLCSPAAWLGDGEGESGGLGPDADFFRDVLIAIIGGVGPVNRSRVATTLQLNILTL